MGRAVDGLLGRTIQIELGSDRRTSTTPFQFKMSSLCPFSLILLISVTLAACGSRGSEQTASSEPARFAVLRPGDEAPPFERRDFSGDLVRVGPDQPWTLLNLWATWCAPCLEEFPDLELLHRDFEPRGLRVIGLNVDELDVDALSKFGEGLGATFALVTDPPATLQEEYKAAAMPSSYLINPEGLVKAVWTGRLPENARDEIESFLP